MSKSIKQLAEEIGVSKEAVRQEIKRQSLYAKLSQSGRQLVVDKKEESLIKSAFDKRKGNKISGAKLSQSCRKVVDDVSAPDLDVINILHRELESKQKIIEGLQKALDETNANLSREQTLHAQTKQEYKLLLADNGKENRNVVGDHSAADIVKDEKRKLGFRIKEILKSLTH